MPLQSTLLHPMNQLVMSYHIPPFHRSWVSGPLALRNWHVHLDAFLAPGHINGPSAASGTPKSIFGSIAATETETDASFWYGQPGSGSYSGSVPSNFLPPQDRWGEVSPLYPTHQSPIRLTPGKIKTSK